MFDLSGKNALVMGATSGLGLALAQTLGTAGARLMLGGPNPDALEQATAHLQALGLDARWSSTKPGTGAHADQNHSLCRLAEETLHRMGEIDILLNHAEAAMPDPTGTNPLALWDACQSHVRHYLVLSQAVAQRSMLARGRGNIINVVACNGNGDGNGDGPACGLFGTAVQQLSQFLGAHWRLQRIAVNTLCTAPMVVPAAGPQASRSLHSACLLLAAAQDLTGQCLTVQNRAAP